MAIHLSTILIDAYYGQVCSVTNEEKKTYSIQYDTFGNVTQIRDCYGKVVTKHDYDSLNRLTSTYDAEGGSTTYTYDSVDRVLS